MLSNRIFLGAGTTVFLLLSSGARADTITVDASVSGTTGAYSYAYEIDNQSAVGLLLFSLEVTGDVGAIQSPTGWITATGSPAADDTLVEWISTDVPFDVPVLGILSGFAITSDSAPGNANFSTFDENFNQSGGETAGPVASTVPEPGSLDLLVAALLGICISRNLPVALSNSLRIAWAMLLQTSPYRWRRERW